MLKLIGELIIFYINSHFSKIVFLMLFMMDILWCVICHFQIQLYHGGQFMDKTTRYKYN
jgi:hypothetical protein